MKRGGAGREADAGTVLPSWPPVREEAQPGARPQRTPPGRLRRSPGRGTAHGKQAGKASFCCLPSVGHSWLLGELSPEHCNGFTWPFQQLLGEPDSKPSRVRSQSQLGNEGFNPSGCRELRKLR